MTTTEWRDARAAGTVGDALTSAMATIGTAGRVLAALDDATVARVNELAELEGARRRPAGAGRDARRAGRPGGGRAGGRPGRPRRGGPSAGGRGGGPRRRADRAGGRRRRGARRRRAPGGAGRPGRGGGRDRPTPPRRSRRSAAATASAPAPAARAARRCPLKEKLALAQQVGQSPTLRQIAALAGRLTRIAHAGPGHPRRPPARRGDVDHRRRRPGPRPADRAGAARRPGDGGPLLRPPRREAPAPVRAASATSRRARGRSSSRVDTAGSDGRRRRRSGPRRWRWRCWRSPASSGATWPSCHFGGTPDELRAVPLPARAGQPPGPARLREHVLRRRDRVSKPGCGRP